ncbi:MAG: FeoA family protein [Filifactoraceae bacterium]
MLPLTMMPIGETGYIAKITGRDTVRQHLAELGFVIGAEVTVISQLGGNMILSVKDSRVALNKEMANRILI